MSRVIDSDRLTRELEQLAAFSSAEPPAVTRVVFSDADLRARRYLRTLCIDAGLEVREDPVGNVFARWPGQDPGLPPVATGSHTDAIPNAGRYDGTVGVLGGLEAIRSLRARGARPRRTIELVMFTSEEPTRFGIGCLGSRLMAGALDAGAGERLRDADALSLDEVRSRAGFDGTLDTVRRPAGAYHAFVELHIEQGPLLEGNGIDIGIVTAIAAPASMVVTVDGQGGHAGAVLMPDRRDALVAAAEIVIAVDAAARASGSRDTVATTGVCQVFPGAVNSVPSRVRLEVDARDIDESRRDDVLARVTAACEEVAARRGVTVTPRLVNADAPAACAPPVIDAIARSCEALRVSSLPMISRAYHDSLFMSRIAPTGMIFIPCRGGISHRPDEYAAPDAIATGAAVLANTLEQLSR